MKTVRTYSDDDVVIIDGNPLKVSYIKTACRNYERTKERSKRYRHRLKAMAKAKQEGQEHQEISRSAPQSGS